MPVAPAVVWIRSLFLYVAGIVLVGLALFVPAGTFDYWQAWLYIAVLFIPFSIAMLYFLLSDPEFIKRRMQFREKEKAQKKIISVSTFIFLIGFLLPGLDRRFGWSAVPHELVLAADALVFLGYLLVFLVLRENRYASRTIGVEEGQKVVAAGPYSVVRHPMYAGTLLMFLLTPVALGSYVALLPFLLFLPLLALRILNEEEVLLRELPGYKEYCAKTRYRLIPFVW